MKPTRLLLIDVSQDGKVAGAIRALLGADTNYLLRDDTVATFGPPGAGTKIPSSTSCHDISAVLLCGSSCSFRNLTQFLEAAQSLKQMPPIIVVTDLCEPEQLTELLRGGASEFLLPPLDAVHVLPRLWRILELFDTEEAEAQ